MIRIQEVSDETRLKMKISRCKRLEKPVDDIERFWSYVDIKGKDECWEWRGGLGNDGHGQYRIKGKTINAHRYLYILVYGEIPKGKQVNHKCNKSSCCNPFHVYAGTHQENMDDKVKAGRQSRAIGELHGCVKLTEKQVIEIREHGGNLSQGQLGKLYGVNHGTIWAIKHRKIWTHI